MSGPEDTTDNPYSAPLTQATPELPSVPERGWLIMGDRVLCRLGTTLPRICLITGGSDVMFAELPLLSGMVGSSPAFHFLRGVFFLTVLAMSLGREFIRQHVSSRAFDILQIGAQFVIYGCAVLFLFLGRSPGGRVTGFLTHSIRSAYRRHWWVYFAVLLCGIVGFSLALTLSASSAPTWSPIIAVPAVVILTLAWGAIMRRSQRMKFPGLQISAQQRSNETVLLKGFSPEFLEALHQIDRSHEDDRTA